MVQANNLKFYKKIPRYYKIWQNTLRKNEQSELLLNKPSKPMHLDFLTAIFVN